jgi:hypothetical protein
MSFYLLWIKKQATLGKSAINLWGGWYMDYLERSTVLECYIRRKRSNAIAAMQWKYDVDEYSVCRIRDRYLGNKYKGSRYDLVQIVFNIYARFSLKKVIKSIVNVVFKMCETFLFRHRIKNKNSYSNLPVYEEYSIDYKKWLLDKYTNSTDFFKQNLKFTLDNGKYHMYYHIKSNTKYFFDILINKLGILKTTNEILSLLDLKPKLIEKIKILGIISLTLLSILLLY